MSAGEKGPAQPVPEPPELDADGLPPLEARAATLTIVMDKRGALYMNYPEPIFISLQLLAHASVLFTDMLRKEHELAQVIAAREPGHIVMPPYLDPRFRKR
jgi:hypothetical protein